MATLIEIHGLETSVLSVGLHDILCYIDNGSQFTWSMLWIEGIGDLENKTMLDFEKEVNKSNNGYAVGWKDLLNLSTSFNQLFEVLLIADKDESKIKRYSSDDEMYHRCDLVIELIDSSYWIIHSNQISLDSMIENLPGVKIIQ